MMLASATMAAALQQDARDAALHLRANQGGAEHALALPAEETSQVNDAPLASRCLVVELSSRAVAALAPGAPAHHLVRAGGRKAPSVSLHNFSRASSRI
jgi:hypothetical protein